MKKKILSLFLLMSFVNISNLFCQHYEGDAKIDIKVYRTFSNTFRVKQYAVTSGKIDIDPKYRDEEKRYTTAGTELGIGLNNKFSNRGGFGLISLFQTSPFTGLTGWFLFEENVNGVWYDAAKLTVDLPVIGSDEVTLQYFDGFGNIDFTENYPPFGTYPTKCLARDYGYMLYDMQGNSTDIRVRNRIYLLEVEIRTRKWLTKSITFPTTGSTTLYGTVRINNLNIKPRADISLEEAVRNTFRLKANFYKEAYWVKLDNDNSSVALSFPTYVGNTIFYDFDDQNGTFKYKITDVPIIINNYKYFESKQDYITTINQYGYPDVFGNPLLYSSGKSILTDNSQKEGGRDYKKFYSWLSLKMLDDADIYWEKSATNIEPPMPTQLVDINNLKGNHEPPKIKIVTFLDSTSFVKGINSKTLENPKGEFFIETSPITIDGIWTTSNGSNGYIIDPNINKIRDKFSPILDPAEANAIIDRELTMSSNNTIKKDTFRNGGKNRVMDRQKTPIKKLIKF
jgi:hypothetical protein